MTELIEQNIDLVRVLVGERLRQLPTHVHRDDLTSAGLMALVLSARAFEPDRGVPFSSFASLRIRGALVDELRSVDWASRSVRSRHREIEAIRAELTHALDRSPRAEEIAGALGISAREVHTALRDVAQAQVVSLDSVGPEIASAAGNHAVSPEHLILERERLGYLFDAVSVLPERLRYVIVEYFFLERQMSCIARELAVTQSRVSQMCAEAVAMLRGGMTAHLDPIALARFPQQGRTAARDHFNQALADRSNVRRRLEMSTVRGEVPQLRYREFFESMLHSRIA